MKRALLPLPRAIQMMTLIAVVFTVFAFAAPMAMANGSGSDIASPGTVDSGAHVVGFVKISENRELYVDYERPVPGRPTVVLLNGLTYRIGCWDAFTTALEGDGLGILRYDAFGQGQTLLKYGAPTEAISIQAQVEDLRLLLSALGINEAVHLVGLSYGAPIDMLFATQYPERTASVILMAPFVGPIASQDVWIRQQINQVRVLYPYNPASFDELYDYFLKYIIYQSYPAAEPIVLENPYKLEATFRMVQGVRKFLAKDIVGQLPAGKVHLMIARKDQYLENSVHEEFWNQIPAAARASLIYIEGSEHKIPEAVPQFAADWVRRIVNGDSQISGGATFVGDPKTNSVHRE
jgi:pimeloyl-ACP methyl ester carboxylesterase